MEKPKVTVIMPVFNREKYLKESIESILNQTFSDFEFLIIDDGSTDNGEKIIKEYEKKDPRIRLLNNTKKKGIVGALNTGIEQAKGDYIARMDSDDISLPERIEKQISFLEKNPEVGACGTWVKVFGKHENMIWNMPVDFENIKSTMLFSTGVANPTGVIRRRLFSELKFWYDDNLIVAEDYDFWTRIAEATKIANLSEVLFLYRTHDSNIGVTSNNKEKVQCSKKVMLKQIEKMKISPTDEELDIHEKIGNSRIIGGKEFIRRANAWLDKLSEANKKTRRYEEKSFQKVINQKRLQLQEYNLSLSVKESGGLIKYAVNIAKRSLKTILPQKIADLLAQLVFRAQYRFDLLYSKTERVRVWLGFGIKLSRETEKNFKIGFAVLAHERPEYLEICLDTLFKTELHNHDITFLINDDGSKNPRVEEIINCERDQKYKIIRNFTPKGPNCAGAAINKAVKKLLEIDDFDIIGWCDPDAVFHPEWLEETMKICFWAKKNHKYHILGPFSSFNSSDYKFHRILGTYKSPFGNYIVKRQMGMLNYFYFKEDFLKLGFFPENRDDETLMTEKFEKLGVRNFCTETSFIEHIGQKSVLNQWRSTPIARAVHGVNLAKGSWGVDMEKISPYGYYKYLKDNVGFGKEKSVKSDLEVDIIIPAIKKDLDILPLTVESVRKNLMHPIGDIYIVGPKLKEIEVFCRDHECVFKDEDSVVPVRLKDIDYKVRGVDRSGWIFQQLLKLGANKISNKDHFYIIDADTILVQPQKFEDKGKIIFLASDEYNIPYFESFKRIFKSEISPAFSFVAHQMLFSRDKLEEFREEIEKKNEDKPWYQAIIDNLDPNETSSFSEYETYGNWMKKAYPENILIEYWFNKSLAKGAKKYLNYYLERYGCNYRSVSLHSYNRGGWKMIRTFLK